MKRVVKRWKTARVFLVVQCGLCGHSQEREIGQEFKCEVCWCIRQAPIPMVNRDGRIIGWDDPGEDPAHPAHGVLPADGPNVV